MSNIDLLVQETHFRFRLKTLGLDAVWDWVKSHNSGSDLPYHNNQHLFHVARIADQLLSLESEPTHADSIVLILACLFHDFDHSGGLLDDTCNIERSIQGLRSFAETDLGHRVFQNDVTVSDVEDLIRITQFPFVHTPQEILGECLRDADLLYSFSSVGTHAVVTGLRQETAVKTGELIKPLDYVKQQREFINSLRMFTSAGTNLVRRIKAVVLDEQVRCIKDTYGIVS